MHGKRVLSRLGGLLMLVLAAFSLQPGGSLPAVAATADGTTTLSTTTTVIRWHGTIIPGNSNAGGVTLRCFSLNPTTDDFAFNLTGVDDKFNTDHRVALSIRIDWKPNTNAASNNLFLTTSFVDANGIRSQVQDGTQLNTTSQSVSYASPMAAIGAARWHAGACAGSNISPQDYTGTATLVIKDLARTTNVSVGNQQLQAYRSTVQNRDAAQRQNAGEPNIGADWESGRTMYMAGSQVSRITWNDRVTPPAATWEDKTPIQSPANEDNILFTDHVTGRTWAVGLLVATSNINCTDDDGESYSQCTAPVPHSPDHETLGSGPYPPGVTPGSYPRAVYYCSQNVVQALGAFCGVSTDGSQSYAPATIAFGAGSGCGAIHGHVRVGPDGSTYLPQKQCGDGEGMAVSRDMDQTYSYPVVPDSTSPGGSGSDPSVVAGSRGTIYYAYSDAARHLMVATSSDHGKPGSWSKSTDVGAAYGVQTAEFPEIITGDDNRAAVAFIGTTTKGNDQAEPPADGFFKGAWDLYVSYTYDRGATWQTAKVPGGPIQRGCVWLGGGSHPCRNLLDFNEITVDKQGRVLVSYTDGCTATCKTVDKIDQSGCGNSEQAPADSTPTCTFARVSAVARQYCGRGLFAAYDGAQQAGCFNASTNAFNPSPGGNQNRNAGSNVVLTQLPNTAGRALSAYPSTWWVLAGAPLAPVVVALIRRRRRRSRGLPHRD
ncbi:MAG: hypothetical protein NVSMB17_11770 [Candidatus Dormibacteria bacterium]